MRTTISRHYDFGDNRPYNSIELNYYQICNGTKENENYSFLTINKNTPVIVKLTLKNIADYYKIDKITFPLKYYYGKQGFNLSIIQGSFNYGDSCTSILNSLNQQNILLDELEFEQCEKVNSQGEKISFNLDMLKFTPNDEGLVATFAILTDNERNVDVETLNIEFFDPISYVEGFPDQIPNILVELMDTRCSNNKIKVSDDLMLNVFSGKLLLNLPLFNVKTNKYGHSLTLSLIPFKDDNTELYLDYGISFIYKFNSNIQLLQNLNTNIYGYEVSNDIIVMDQSEYPIYFSLVSNTDETSYLFDMFSISDKNLCGYSFKDNLCIYYEDDKYIITDNKNNRIYLNFAGQVEKLVNSNNQEIQYKYNENDNFIIRYKGLNENNIEETEVIMEAPRDQVLLDRIHIVSSNIYAEVEENRTENEQIFTFLQKNENNEILSEIIINVDYESSQVIIENTKNNSMLVATYQNNKVTQITEKLKNTTGEYVIVAQTECRYEDLYTVVKNKITNEMTHYFLDKYKNISEIKTNNEISSFVKYNDYGNCIDNTCVKKPLTGIVKNGGFEDGSLYWTGNEVEESSGVFGSCIKANQGQMLYQDINLYGGDEFRIEGFLKHNTSESNVLSTIVLEIGYKVSGSNSIISTVTAFEIDKTRSDWYHFESDWLTLPKGAYDIMPRLFIYAEDELFVDELKVVTKNKRVDNLINEDFFTEVYSNVQNGNNQYNIVTERHSLSVDEDNSLMDGGYNNKVLKLSGCNRLNDSAIQIYKNINIEGMKDDVYFVEAYVKNANNRLDTSQLFIEYINGDKKEKHIFETEKCNHNYQRVYGLAIAKSDFTSIKVGYEYLGNTDLYISQFKLMKIDTFSSTSYDNKIKKASLTNRSQQLNIIKDDKVVKQMSINGSYVEYEYDEKNRVVKEKDIFGNSKEYTYDNIGRPLVTTLKKGNGIVSKQINLYLEFANSVQDEFNNETIYYLNNRKEVESVLYPNTLKTYISTNSLRLLDECGIATTVNDLYVNNKYIDYTYDSNRNLTLVEHKDGSKYSYTVTPSGQVLRVLKDNALLEEYTYTQDLKLETVTTPIGKTKYIYDESGKVVKIILFKNTETSSNDIIYITYDEQGKIIFISRPCTNELVTYKYDKEERLIEEKNLKNNETIRYEYDSNNNVTVTYINNGQTREIEHKKVLMNNNNEEDLNVIYGLLTKSKDIFFYDKFDEGILGTKKSLCNLNYTYDSSLGIDVLNANLKTHIYDYDLTTFCDDLEQSVSNIAIKNKHELLNELSTNKTFSMWIKPKSIYEKTGIFMLTDDGRSNVDVYIEGSGKVSLYINDTKKIETNTLVSLYEWNYISLSIIKRGVDDSYIDYYIMANNEVKHYQDDFEFPLDTATTLRIGKVVNGSDLSLDVTQGNTRLMPFNIAYLSVSAYPHTQETLLNEYESTKKQFIDKTNPYYYETKVTQNNNTYTYKSNIDTLGRLIKRKFIKNDTNIYTKTYQYTKSRLTKETSENSEIMYTYDNMGNITSKNGTTYEYDLLGRLIRETTNNEVTTYEYDDNNNLTKKTKGNTVTTYSYNKDILQNYTVNQQTKTLEYSNNIFYPSKIANNTLTWDKGMLTQYGNTTFEYNQNRQRIKKETGTKVHTYIYERDLIIKEKITDSTGNINVTLEYI